MSRISDIRKKWVKEPNYRKTYEALEEEPALSARFPFPLGNNHAL
jgi:hypothetical protein